MKKKKNLFIIAFLCFITLVGVTIAYLQSSAVLENIFNAGTYKTVTHEEFVSPSNWTPGDTTAKTITTKNEGTIPVLVRVKLEEEWTSKNNEGLPLTFTYTLPGTDNDNTGGDSGDGGDDCFYDEDTGETICSMEPEPEPIEENAAIINFINENEWIKDGDYYYYSDVLNPGETTSSLISGVTFNPNVNADVNCTTVNNTVTCESSGSGYDGATYKLRITTETIQYEHYTDIWGMDAPILYDYVGDNPCTFDGELVPGAEYVNGQYTYKYRQRVDDEVVWHDINDDGWGVLLTDRNSTDPVTTQLCSSINNKPITSLAYTFYRSEASSIDLSNADLTNVKSLEGTLASTTASTLDLSNKNTKKLTNTSFLFYGTRASSINIDNLNTSNVTTMRAMFYRANANVIDVSKIDTKNVTDMSSMFSGSLATEFIFGDFNTSKVTTMRSMFWQVNADTLDLRCFDTSNVTTMYGMFYETDLTSLNLSSFDTSNVTDMSYMFKNLKAETLDLSSFDTSKVTIMMGMLFGVEAKTLDLTNFNTSNVTDMHGMFMFNKSESINLSSFDTSKVIDMSSMFSHSTIPVIDLSSFNTSNVETMDSMFSYSSATTINMSSFNTSKVTDMSSMFSRSTVPVIDLSSFDTTSSTDVGGMFSNASATTGYAKTQADADNFNASSNKPSTLTFVVKNG